MNTENETGVKVPKGPINYNTVAGSLGLAAFAGLGLRNQLGNGNGSVTAGATAFQNLKREIDNSLKNNVSHDERPA